MVVMPISAVRAAPILGVKDFVLCEALRVELIDDLTVGSLIRFRNAVVPPREIEIWFERSCLAFKLYMLEHGVSPLANLASANI